LIFFFITSDARSIKYQISEAAIERKIRNRKHLASVLNLAPPDISAGIISYW